MPIFEYQCKKCGHVTDVLEKAGTTGKHTCTQCGSTRMVKLLSPFGVAKTSASSLRNSCPTGTCSLTR